MFTAELHVALAGILERGPCSETKTRFQVVKLVHWLQRLSTSVVGILYPVTDLSRHVFPHRSVHSSFAASFGV